MGLEKQLKLSAYHEAVYLVPAPSSPQALDCAPLETLAHR